MKITVVAVGKIKEKYFRDAIEEYSRRLGRFCRLELIEVADEKTPEGAGALMEEQIREKEGGRILQRLPSGAFVAALAIDGRCWTPWSCLSRWNGGMSMASAIWRL